MVCGQRLLSFAAPYQVFQRLLQAGIRERTDKLAQVLLSCGAQCRRSGGGSRLGEADLHAYLNYSNLMTALLQVF